MNTDALIELSADGLIIGWSEAAQRLYGYAAAQAVGRPVDLLESRSRAGAIRRHLGGDRPALLHFPSEHRTSGGEALAVDVTLATGPSSDEGGHVIHCLIRDVVAQRALQVDDAHLSHLARVARDALFCLDEHGRVTHWNEAAERLYGWSAEEAVGQRLDALTITTADLDAALEAMRERRFVYDRLEVPRRRKDGTMITVSVTAWPREVDGRFAGMITAAFDVTERRGAEQAQARLAAIVESSEDAIVGLTLDGQITSWNSAAQRLWGYPASQTIGQFVSTERRVQLERFLADIAAGRSIEPEEAIGQHQDGHEVVVSVMLSAIRDGSGVVVGAASIARDITAQRGLERAREQALRDLEEAQRLARIGSWSWHPEIGQTWSAQLYELYEIDPAHGHPTTDALLARVRPGHHERIFASGEAIQAGRDVEPFELETTSGRLLVTRARRDPESGAYIGTVQDVTEERAAEHERARLLEARALAESANRAKNEFLARMSHEFRTPLNAIIGFSQLLELDDLQPRQREDVRFVLKAGNHLLRLINESLDIAQIEAGRIAISPEPVPVHEAVHSALSLVEPMARQRDIALELESEGLEPDGHVQADVNRFTQVLLNLLSNAIKYNREGGSVRVRLGPPADGELRIAITDTGPGIAPDEQARLFEPFERLGAAHSEIEGNGLGLTVSRGLVTAMGGEIEVVSAPGEGSTFIVVLPAALAPQEGEVAGAIDTAPALAAVATEQPRVVVHIEDNPSNLALVERVLARQRGIELLPAMRGARGLELARRHRPDLVLLDLHLPDMSGLEVLGRLRASGAEMPIVVLSATATPGQAEAALEHGATHFVNKPFDVPAFLALVGDCLTPQTRVD